MELKSERDRKRSIQNYDFFERKQREREAKRQARERLPAVPDLPMREALETPVGPEFDPDLDSYRQSVPTAVPPIPEATDNTEAPEREAKRLRVNSEGKIGTTDESGSFCFKVLAEEFFLGDQARKTFCEKA